MQKRNNLPWLDEKEKEPGEDRGGTHVMIV